LPEELYDAFIKAKEVIEGEILESYKAKDVERDIRIRLLKDQLYLLDDFTGAMESFDSHYEFFIFYRDGELEAEIFCLDTGEAIRQRLSLGKSTVFFSGTLSPIEYYKDILGGDRSSAVLEVDSPFAPEHLSVSVISHVSTRFNQRDDTLLSICRYIAATLSAKRGNYMIFSPSFAYCEKLYSAFRAKYPKIRTILQKADMTSLEKREFLEEFERDDGSYLAAFCVTGGIYSEGIDLTGDRLIGAVIVGVGLPTPSFEREAICAYYDEVGENGKLYAYIYPGMNKVLQAAGRVIRCEDDRGVIVLIDDRFEDPIYRSSAPYLWRDMKFFADPKALNEHLKDFWEGK
jgi:Rad3-related DNA helicase